MSVAHQFTHCYCKLSFPSKPDSTRDQDSRDQDLRELIGGRRHYTESRHAHPLQPREGKRGHGHSEDDEGELIEEEEELATPTTTMASVVKLVER